MLFLHIEKIKIRNKHKNVTEWFVAKLFLYCMEKNEKKTIGKCGQKELLVFHGQLNWYIFHTFHNKNGFHIHWVDYHFF